MYMYWEVSAIWILDWKATCTCNNINLTAALYKTYNINNISNTDTPCRKKVTKQSPVKFMAYDCPVFSL